MMAHEVSACINSAPAPGIMKNDAVWRPPLGKRLQPETAVPNGTTSEPIAAPDVKRSRSQFLSPEHHKLLRRYIVNVASVIAEREKKAFTLEDFPTAVDSIINAISKIIGDLWETSVELSKMRIDTMMDDLVGEIIVDESVEVLERMKRFDRAQRQRLAADSAAQSGDEEAPGGSAGATAPPAPPGATSAGRATLFEAQPGLSGEQEEVRRAKEAAIVTLKQAELTREVNVNYLTAALDLHVSGGAALVQMPERARKMFTAACALFYENFVERVLVNYIQQRQQKRPPAA